MSALPPLLLPALAFLLPLAALSGWFYGRRSSERSRRAGVSELSSSYFRGLNYLLNEQPDKAIEVFLKLAEFNRDTVETHLALGNLFRRRGEVDHAPGEEGLAVGARVRVREAVAGAARDLLVVGVPQQRLEVARAPGAQAHAVADLDRGGLPGRGFHRAKDTRAPEGGTRGCTARSRRRPVVAAP